ncbi:MAG TPA: 5-bromo-4-chloroindolyl phosphate hydrolysis family protein [Candidatus Limiplasma sp.]|nr:5-bromo-4-chloroindolyl phosphate hydrolysis family protein [Candidatus Limiplasma sp.]HPR79459.1 5-bromo-4-chloroindolyl phosphate hydrolysis family protein [Candidatus Limiplasma sp.]
MSNQDKKQRKRKGKGSGFIAFGVVFALYAVMFHPYSLGRLLLGLILAGLISSVIRVMGSGLDLTTHNKQDAVPESLEKVAKDTGNPDVDALLQKGREMISEIREENRKIPDEGLSDKLDQLEKLCGDIFKAVYDKPAKASQIRKFMDYYLPTTLKMVRAYRTLGENGVNGEAAVGARSRIDDALGIVLKGCRKMLDNLYEDDVLDITTDIDVLEQMLKRDGLTESDLHLAAEQAKQAAALNDQVERRAAAARVQQEQSAAQTVQPAQQAYDPAQWHAGQTTDVASQVQSAVQQAQAHAPQAPVLHMGGQATAQAPEKQQ